MTITWKESELIKKLKAQHTPKFIPPTISNNLWDFIKNDIPMLGNIKRNLDLIPYWKQIYLDTHKNKIVRAGRQTGKTTYMADRILFKAFTNDSKEICYVADNEKHKSAFSNDRLRKDGILANPKMRSSLPNGHRVAVDRIDMLTGVSIHLGSVAGDYNLKYVSYVHF